MFNRISGLVLPLLFVLIPMGSVNARNHNGLPHAFDIGWKGLKVCEILHEDAGVRIARCTFPPGVGHERHYHLPHFGYTLSSGTMQIKDAEGGRDPRRTQLVQ